MLALLRFQDGNRVERSEALAGGFDQLLTKPVDFAQIEAALARLK